MHTEGDLLAEIHKIMGNIDHASGGHAAALLSGRARIVLPAEALQAELYVEDHPQVTGVDGNVISVDFGRR